MFKFLSMNTASKEYGIFCGPSKDQGGTPPSILQSGDHCPSPLPFWFVSSFLTHKHRGYWASTTKQPKEASPCCSNRAEGGWVIIKKDMTTRLAHSKDSRERRHKQSLLRSLLCKHFHQILMKFKSIPYHFNNTFKTDKDMKIVICKSKEHLNFLLVLANYPFHSTEANRSLFPFTGIWLSLLPFPRSLSLAIAALFREGRSSEEENQSIRCCPPT